MVTAVENETELSEKISARMEHIGMDINTLAVTADITYEHARGIVRGIRVPSKRVLKDIAAALDIPYDTVDGIATAARIRHRFGDVSELIGHKKAGMEPIERVWDKLNDDQKATLVDMARSMAKRSGTR